MGTVYLRNVPDDVVERLERLAAFKVPARIWLSETPLPKLGSGKIDKVTIRRELRDLYTKQNA